MPVSFRVLPEHFLVYVRHHGRLEIDEATGVLADIIAHPDHRIGMRGLVDLSSVTDWDRNFTALMRHQAYEAEVHDNPLRPNVVVYYAPTEPTRALASVATRVWKGSDRVITVIAETEADALSILGVEMPSFKAMLQSA